MSLHSSHPRRPVVGIHRRELLQIGYSGLLGMGWADWLARQARAKEAAPESQRRARSPKSVILVFLTGAPSHHDTFDMKPDAPAEIRGDFQPIATSVPGLYVCEHLPKLAARARHYAVVRTLAHGENNHLMATHMLLTGHSQPGAFFDKVASRDDWPGYSAALNYLRPRHDPLPSGVNLPTFLAEGSLTWPGQHAGLLGAMHDPWQITADPNASDFRVDSVHLAPGISIDRFHQRRGLLDQVNRRQRQLADALEHRNLTEQQRLAFSLLASGSITQAFEIDREPAAVRDRYGRDTLGQSLLLARRLTEVGVPIVQVNVGRAQAWDHHSNIFPALKQLLPPLDHGLSALLDDLAASGRLDDTLVLLLGEFGRTPKVKTQPGSGSPGRDHWGNCFFGLFAGGGVQGGQVIGKSDKIGAYPLTKPYSADDVGATVYHVLGIDPASEIRDRLNRPMRLNQGQWIEPLFTGRAT
ncbi:MAG TPA: DUF1501 domain-containing protein [Pirellulales bacterium]|nr:DUF1501 domain-containing protein [Pirellulales bacterium]